tara:strand:- start:4574 stop:4732 length:159 start_codon:yes stop_codon:yes gene_type:complete
MWHGLPDIDSGNKKPALAGFLFWMFGLLLDVMLKNVYQRPNFLLPNSCDVSH